MQDLEQRPEMPDFLVVYDYGTGGRWYRMTAPSAQLLREAFPEFVVFDQPPSWWREGMFVLRSYTLGEPQDATLRSLVDDARKNRVNPKCEQQ